LFFFAVRLRLVLIFFAFRFFAPRLPASDSIAHSRQVRLRPNADNMACADDLFATDFILLNGLYFILRQKEFSNLSQSEPCACGRTPK